MITINTRILTNEEEKIVLRNLLRENILSNGSSRTVFRLTDEIADLLQVNKNDYVVKLAMGVGGYRQNQLEINTYLTRGDSGYFAEIIAYGKYVEIMEYVEVEDWRDEADDYEINIDSWMEYNFRDQREDESDEDYADSRERMINTLEEIDSVIAYLDDIFGQTSDNGQLGLTRDGHYVAYDYGFTTDRPTDEQTSDMSDVAYSDRAAEYIQDLMNLLDAEEEVLEHYEKVFLRDENGDGTYTRYEVKMLQLCPSWAKESHNDGYWMVQREFTSMEYFDNDKEDSRAYQAIKKIYNLDNDLIHEEVIDTFIPTEYSTIWEKHLDKLY